jgi:signal transduction histidine kinase
MSWKEAFYQPETVECESKYTMSDGTEKLKAKMTALLEQPKLDYGGILSLANDISKLDEENVRFTVDASHISRLGIELVSKQETAVAELIKNAFDADATVVNLIFRGTNSPGGVLEIIDNGNGMSRSELTNGFMRISTQDKVHNPRSSKYGRQRAGRKGIGRFAAQRLGKRLLISTQREDQQDSLSLYIDWTQFEGGKDLFLVASQVQVGKPQKIGTLLRIGDVRDAWTEAQIQRTYRYISALLQPFPLNKQPEIIASEINPDPGFKVTVFREQSGGLEPIAGEDQSIFPYALAKFSGRIDGDGTPFVRITSSKFDLDFEKAIPEFDIKIKSNIGAPSSYLALKGVRFSTHYFVQDELPSGTRSMVREILNTHGGIRIYRNGFRVLPYGEQFDDWLGLQRSSALRELLPPHHNTNFLGFVEIEDVDGSQFEETASREGLLENSAFLQLQDFIYRAIMAGVIELARLRKKKLYASDPRMQEEATPQKESAHDIAEQLREIARRAEQVTTTPPIIDLPVPPTPSIFNTQPDMLDSQVIEPNGLDLKSDELNSHLSEEENKNLAFREEIKMVKVLAERVEELGTASNVLLEENGMLRVLASLGLTIGEFTHEVRHTLAGLVSTIAAIGEFNKESNEPTSKYDSLRRNIELLQSYVRYFDDAVMQNAHRKLYTHEIRDLINDFSEMIQPTLTRQGVDLTKRIDGYDLYTKPMHRSEWASVFLNLFTNALKAIHRSGKKGRIHILAERVDNFLRIEFSDNGDGIPKENNERIFEAFFTTSAAPGVLASDSEKLIGTGLGLKIVRDIIDAANGEITLVEPKNGFSTCFRIEVPAASIEEIHDEYS